jgi:hypothetical protein
VAFTAFFSTKMSVDSWEPEQVNEFIAQLGLNYSLKQSNVDGNRLIIANHSMLKDYGISLVGHRLKLIS